MKNIATREGRRVINFLIIFLHNQLLRNRVNIKYYFHILMAYKILLELEKCIGTSIKLF